MNMSSIYSEYDYELARSNWHQGQREELARHHDLEYVCPVCGLVWRQPKPEPPFRVHCPKCAGEETT